MDVKYGIVKELAEDTSEHPYRYILCEIYSNEFGLVGYCPAEIVGNSESHVRCLTSAIGKDPFMRVYEKSEFCNQVKLILDKIIMCYNYIQ